MLDYGIFYEFILMDFWDMEQKVIRLADVELFTNYAL
jgi:hypothetical protein